MLKVMVHLPTYDLGPGREHDELVVNVLVYGMFLALLLTALWVLLPFTQHRRQRKRDD